MPPFPQPYFHPSVSIPTLGWLSGSSWLGLLWPWIKSSLSPKLILCDCVGVAGGDGVVDGSPDGDDGEPDVDNCGPEGGNDAALLVVLRVMVLLLVVMVLLLMVQWSWSIDEKNGDGVAAGDSGDAELLVVVN